MNQAFTAISAIVLFLYGLQSFSKEIQQVGGGAFSAATAALTKTRWRGFALGAVLTALIQSSSAVSAITVALVDAGTVSFSSSLAVLLGANVGTTSTAFLVSFKLTGIGPVFIVLGALLSALPLKARIFGKVVFYFGFILFALDFIGGALGPLRESPWISSVLGTSGSLYVALALGAAITALVQSSSVTTGMAILMTQQGLMAPEAAIAVVIGSNVGTTSTSLVAAMSMARSARRAAVANLVFNATGMVLLLPVLGPFATAVAGIGGAELGVALAHLFFNLLVAGLFLLALGPFERVLDRVMPPARVAT